MTACDPLVEWEALGFGLSGGAARAAAAAVGELRSWRERAPGRCSLAEAIVRVWALGYCIERLDGDRAVLAAPAPPDEGPWSLRVHVAGLSFEDRARHLPALRVGRPLALVREPANPYDGNAIRIETPEGAHLGYVPRVLARGLAAYLDAGSRHGAVLDALDPGAGLERAAFARITELDARDASG